LAVVGSAEATTLDYAPVKFINHRMGHNSSSSAAPDIRTARFAALHEALRAMGELPEGHSFHVDAVTTAKAAGIIGFIAENFDVSVPQVFPQDGEAVVFTWGEGAMKRYLTIAGDDVDLMDVNKALRIRCEHNLSPNGSLEYNKLIDELGGAPISHSVSLEGNV
jgi:hypothetical protein